MLYGGDIEHSCNIQRSIGYYLEVLICLAPFTKQMLRATLTGVTSDETDPSVSVHSSIFSLEPHEASYTFLSPYFLFLFFLIFFFVIIFALSLTVGFYVNLAQESGEHRKHFQ